MASLTHEDLDAARALWQEWVGDGFDLTVIVVGEHEPARMDPDRPLGAIVTAGLSLRIVISMIPTATENGIDVSRAVIFDEACPYDGAALRASVAVLARTIAEL